MKRIFIVVMVLVATASFAAEGEQKPAGRPAKAAPEAGPALQFKMKDISGKELDLARCAGKVVVIVNVASRCGYTPQYAGLQALHEKYAKSGLVVLGFPCNQFGGQEPGTDAEVADFCTQTFGVKFKMFSKVDVNGENACPLYKYLTGDTVPIEDKGAVRWNFEKFLISREGEVVARFRSNVTPEQMEDSIKVELAKGKKEK